MEMVNRERCAETLMAVGLASGNENGVDYTCDRDEDYELILLVNGSVCVAEECEIFSQNLFSGNDVNVNVKVRQCHGSSEKMNSRSAIQVALDPRDVCSVEGVCWETARLTSHMTTAEQDNDTSATTQITSWRCHGPPSCLGGSSHRWVLVNTHSTPMPTTVGRPWVAQQHYPHHNLFTSMTSSDVTVHGLGDLG